MIKQLEKNIEQKLMIVEADGHSKPLIGDVQEKRYGDASGDLLPGHLAMGWKVVNMTTFGEGQVLVLIEKESKV
jgi:hypothetical protein